MSSSKILMVGIKILNRSALRETGLRIPVTTDESKVI